MAAESALGLPCGLTNNARSTSTEWPAVSVRHDGRRMGAGRADDPAGKAWRAPRPPARGTREVMNAIRYVNRSGCQWRMLPKDFADDPAVLLPPAGSALLHARPHPSANCSKPAAKRRDARLRPERRHHRYAGCESDRTGGPRMTLSAMMRATHEGSKAQRDDRHHRAAARGRGDRGRHPGP